MNYSKRHNKFLLPVPVKAIYQSFCRTENEIINVVNYNSTRIPRYGLLVELKFLYLYNLYNP